MSEHEGPGVPEPEPPRPDAVPPEGAPAFGTPPPYGPPGYGVPPGYAQPPGYGSAPDPGYAVYGQQYGYGPQHGYGQPYGYPPQYGAAMPPYGWSRPPEASSLRTQAIVALVVSVASVLFCCSPLLIASAITSGIAIGRVDTDLDSARRLVRWSWGLVIASVVLGVAFFAVFVGMGAFSEPGP